MLHPWIQHEKQFISVHLTCTSSASSLPSEHIRETNAFIFSWTAFYVGFNKHFHFIAHQTNNSVYWTTLTIKAACSSFQHLNLLLLFWYRSRSCSVLLYLFSLRRSSCSFFAEACIIFKSSSGFLCSTRIICISFFSGFQKLFVCESALN